MPDNSDSPVLNLSKDIMACRSVTPLDDGAQDILARRLEKLSFEIHHLRFGAGRDEVPNLFAIRGGEGTHLCFGGHTDVVPPGDAAGWTSPPFAPEIRNGRLYGRGASDMKSNIAAFICALENLHARYGDLPGRISLVITGDEEGPAVNGTCKVIEWMRDRDLIPDVALVGEPTSPDHLGQEIKIGRRGSFSATLGVTGKQGHVAYPHNADNPVPAMVDLLQVLCNLELDAGNEHFPPSNLEITSVDIGNPAFNVIPERVEARFNIRFNDIWTLASLKDHVRSALDESGHSFTLEIEGDGTESFLTKPGPWCEMVAGSVEDICGHRPALATTGGTSDARFFAPHCPVVECGHINATVHQIDENVPVEALEKLVRVYERIIQRYFKDA